MSTKLRRRALGMPILQALVVSLFVAQGMYGDWVQFNVTSINPGQSAIGFEQIFQVQGTGAGGNGLTPGTTGFDYAYLLLNTGTQPIRGFFFDVGVPNTRAGVAAFVANSAGAPNTFTAKDGRDDAVFPTVFRAGGPRPTPNINGELGPFFFDSSPIYPINGRGVNPLPPAQGRLQQWGFEQFWNPTLTAYLARWYSNTPRDGIGPLRRGRFDRFDVFSPFGPVPGGGGVDPLDTGNFIGLDDGVGDLSNLVPSPAVTPCDPTVPGSCDMTLPMDFTGTPLGPTGNSNNMIPEPATMTLLLFGLAGIGFSIQRRTRR